MSTIKMEEGMDYVDIARSLISPATSSYQPWKPTTSWSATEQNNVPQASVSSPQPLGGVSAANETYFSQNRASAASPSHSTLNNAGASAASPAPQDRAAQLRAQLLASRKITPDPARPNNVFAEPARKTSQPMPDVQNNEPFARPATTQPAVTSDDVDALIASAAGPYLSHGRNPAGDSSKEDGEISSGERGQNGTVLVRDVEHGSPVSRYERPQSSQMGRPDHGSPLQAQNERRSFDQSADARRVSFSNGDFLERKKAFDRDREDRTRAAAEYKASRAQPNDAAAAKTKSNEQARKEFTENANVNGGARSKASDQTEVDGGAAVKRPTLESFDVNTVPTEVVQWLEISGFYDVEFRTRELDRCNKLAELQRQMEELQKQGLEDRTRISRAPATMSAQPSAATVVPQPAVAVAPKQEAKKTEPVPTSSPTKSTINGKRPREEDMKPLEPTPKATKTESRSLESRITRPEDIPDRARGRRSSPPSRNGYESYHSGPPREERDRYDFPPRRFASPYEDREREQRERELRERKRERDRLDYEERERYGRLGYDEAEEKSHTKKNKAKKQWSGIPCVPCRYFKQGSCHRGSACTFLHE